MGLEKGCTRESPGEHVDELAARFDENEVLFLYAARKNGTGKDASARSEFDDRPAVPVEFLCDQSSERTPGR